MKVLLLIFATILFQAHFTFSQQASNSYHSPLGIPLVLASNFGELRPNHFHMGLDFKTNNKEGYNIYAIEEGYVSRIKVSTYGYGKVIYIDHPNGITSVYGHCSEFKGELDSLVHKTQNAEQNFEIEIFPGKNTLKVAKGEVIALSGNTGGSTGPHLHFELRDTKTEQALNPLVYGFDIADSKAPTIRNVKIYGITKDGYRIPGKEVSKAVVKGSNGFTIASNKISISSSFCTESGGIGLAFDVIDYLDGAANQCGLYGSYLIVDGDTLFGQKTDRVPFESTRFVNSHKDYEAYQNERKKYHKSFRTAENDLPIYINNSLGVLKTAPEKSHQIEYIAYDPKGNRSVFKFTLEILSGAISSGNGLNLGEDYLHPQEVFEYHDQGCELEAGYGTVYEPMTVKMSTIASTIGDRETPVSRAYKIKLKASAPYDGKHYIEIITANGKARALDVIYQDGWAIAESSYFGTYSLKRDETPPTVFPSGFSTTVSATATKLQWKISDNASGIADYDLFIDGKWMLIEYDYKSGLVTFTRPENFKGNKEVKIVVKDSCGNINTQTKTINFL